MFVAGVRICVVLTSIIILLFNSSIADMLSSASKSYGSTSSPWMALDVKELLHNYLLVCGPARFCDTSGLEVYHQNLTTSTNNTVCTMCHCDNMCYIRGDCCPDVTFAVPEAECRQTVVLLGITGSTGEEILMIDKCPHSSDLEDRSKCEGYYNVTEVLQAPPVISEKYYQTFRNRHCAECNNVRNFSNFYIDIDCYHFADFNFLSTYREMGELAMKKDCFIGYSFDRYETIPCSGGTPTPPVFSTSTIDYCNTTGHWKVYDPDIEKACLSEYYLTYRYFKNIFCFLCNPPSFSDITEVISQCNVTGVWSPYEQQLLLACQKSPSTINTFPYKNVFCNFCNRNNTKYGHFMDVAGQVMQTLEHPSPDKTVFLYNIKVNSFDHESFIKSQPSEVVTASKVASPVTSNDFERYGKGRFVDRNGILHTESGEQVNITKLLLLDYATNGVYAYCDGDLTFNMFHSESCYCDPACYFDDTGKCCMDLLLSLPISCQTNVLFSAQSDIPDVVLPLRTDVGLIDRCVNSYAENALQQKCENPNDKSIYSILPITDDYTDVIYRNIYCYLCNNNYTSGQNLHQYRYSPWEFELACTANLNVDFHLSVGGIIDLAIKQGCEVHTRSGDSKAPAVRTSKQYCARKNNIDRCNTTNAWIDFDTDVLWACEQSGPSRYQYKNFKNVFCALCNPVPQTISGSIDVCSIPSEQQRFGEEMIEECTALPEVSTTRPYKNIFCKYCNTNEDITMSSATHASRPNHPTASMEVGQVIPSFHDLFNPWKFQDPAMIGGKKLQFKLVKFSDEQFYDAVTDRYRNVTCFPGKRLVETTCTPLLHMTTDLRYNMAFSLKGTITQQTLFYAEDLRRHIKKEILDSLSLKLLHFDSFYLVSNVSCVDLTVGYNRSLPVEFLVYTTFLIEDTVDRLLTENILQDMTSRNFTFRNDTLQAIRTAEAFRVPSYLDKLSHIGYCYHVQRSEMIYQSAHYNRAVYVSDLLTCRQVELEKDEFSVDSSKFELSVKYTNNVILFNEFYLTNNHKARICVNSFEKLMTSLPKTQKQKASPGLLKTALGITTLICTIISLTCLFLTFVTYVLFSKIRSIPGINLMSLVFSMFFAQALFQFGLQQTDVALACKTIGVLLHFFWLATFGCMSVCSFHMYSVFVTNALAKRFSDEKSKKVLTYLMYSYGLSAVIVVITVVSVYTILYNGDIGYGNGTCFISNQIAFFAAFLVPILLICITNIYFFIRTALAIKAAPKIDSTKERKNDFKIFVKLFTLTGVIWVFVILDALQPISFFSFLLTLLTGCQGLFIFVSYVCNKRVWSFYKKRFGKTKHFKHTSSSNTHSTNSKSNSSTVKSSLTVSSQL